jgi:molecular chaperone GrpE
MIDRQSQDVEELLDRFRRWLEAARIEADAPGADGLGAFAGPDGTGPEFGLVHLVEDFTALRHELKLQTKSGRALLEQAESMVAALRQAIEHFRSVEPKEARAAWAAGKPIAEALADLDESLARGRREIERISRRLGEDSALALVDAVDERFRRQSWLRRLLTADYHRQVQNVVRGAGWLRGELLEAIIEGYGLIQARLARVMAAEQIERIVSEGHPVDPERMTVIEVVDDPDRPPGTVVKELRSGYTWRGRLLRYAEVQAASVLSGPRRPPAGTEDDEALDDIGLVENGDDGDGDIDEPYDGRDEGVDLDIETGGPGAGRPHSH